MCVQEKVKHMEEKLQKSRSQLVEEKMKLSKATEEVDQLRVDQQILEDRLCREEAKVSQSVSQRCCKAGRGRDRRLDGACRASSCLSTCGAVGWGPCR